MLIEEIDQAEFISGLMIAWMLSLSSNCQFNLENTYQYKMDIYTQTILPVELWLIIYL